MCQCVEHGHVWDAPAPGKPLSGHTGEPVMAVQQVIGSLLAARKLFDVEHKGGEILVKLALIHRCNRTGLNVDHTHTRSEVNDLWLIGLCATCKDINDKVRAAQLAGQFTNIDIHAPGVFRTPWHGQRRRMDAEHGYSITHT